MFVSSSGLLDNKALILSISVLCKDYFSLAEINRLFIYAGANETWKADLEPASGSQRMDRVNEWVIGIRKNAPNELGDTILENVSKMILNEYDPDTTESHILREVLEGEGNPNIVHSSTRKLVPDGIEELLDIIINTLPRAMYPFKNRRSDRPSIGFTDEYDLQDLFYTLLLPWVKDIRSEEYTPSYAGSSTRMDFLLFDHKIVCELKFVRDATHARKVGDELTIDIAHYRKHPDCKKLVAVICDSKGLISNPDGLKTDIEGDSQGLEVIVFIIPQRTLT